MLVDRSGHLVRASQLEEYNRLCRKAIRQRLSDCDLESLESLVRYLAPLPLCGHSIRHS